jgi:hypothetical protein
MKLLQMIERNIAEITVDTDKVTNFGLSFAREEIA